MALVRSALSVVITHTRPVCQHGERGESAPHVLWDVGRQEFVELIHHKKQRGKHRSLITALRALLLCDLIQGMQDRLRRGGIGVGQEVRQFPRRVVAALGNFRQRWEATRLVPIRGYPQIAVPPTQRKDRRRAHQAA